MAALYAACLALRRDDPVLCHRSRLEMQAFAASDRLLVVRRWHGSEQRLIVVNHGVAVDAAPGTAGIAPDIASLEWRTLLCTDERRFGGAGDSVRLDEQLVAFPAQSATLLAATTPSAPRRAARRVLGALRRGA
jgi:hypothetical protein